MLSNPVSSHWSPSKVPDGPPSVLLDEYEECWGRVRSPAPETLRRERGYLDRFVTQIGFYSSCQLVEWLSGLHVQHFVIEYAERYGPGSQKWMQHSLRSFLRFCHHQGYVNGDLSGAVPARRRRHLARVPKSFDDACIDRLLASIDRSCPLGRRDAAIIILATTYGVRGVQLRRLCLENIDWENELILFPAVKRGKALRLPLTAEAGNAIPAYLGNGRPNQAPYAELFLRIRRPFRPFYRSSSFSGIVSRRLRQAGIEPPEGVSRGLHPFRHAFASRLAGRVPFKHIADLLGHRDISSTFIYTKVDFPGLRETALPRPEEVAP